MEIQQEASADLDAILAQQSFDEVFINLGKLYLLALAASHELPQLGEKAHYATGGIGEKMAQMKRWSIHISTHQVPS